MSKRLRRKQVGFMQSCCLLSSACRANNICRPPVKSHLKSRSHVICISSACCPHVVHTRFQPQKYFQLHSRATALLKTDKQLLAALINYQSDYFKSSEWFHPHLLFPIEHLKHFLKLNINKLKECLQFSQQREYHSSIL